MKISKIIALSLTMASTQALAFQAKDAFDADRAKQPLRAVEENVIGNFYHHYGAQNQAINLATGTCAAVPVAGCGCPFCSMLRSQKV
ncbi:hypothetical protein CHU32_00210 [Superficieibacter electus]|uniref:Uncharacterized protein n=1 Tax=Superficieibacter electus TaxID=2022662 RepID=A0A2P5GVN5_9ENTR|nr:hypothetical protein [Superficieibacter electus]POP47614.1 hypothetical protein CHU33_00210 [Superficieibacter electus]POP50625.1 hypothetical protein CHU32_00210 [Superficieibacter electus]